MNWGDAIDAVAGGRKIVTLATATTGLYPDEGDELIGVCVDDNLVLRKVENSLLLKSQEYHCVTGEMLAERGLSDDDFRESLSKLLEGSIALTYNVNFQQDFLNRWLDGPVLADLPLVWKGASSQMAVDACDDAMGYFKALASMTRGKVGFRSLCQRLGLQADDGCGIYLPVEYASGQLWQLYSRFRALPALIQAKFV